MSNITKYPFWVCSVNNWLVDAGFNGKELKTAHPTPSFRKFYFIRTEYDLNGFKKHGNYDNKTLVNKWLSSAKSTPQ